MWQWDIQPENLTPTGYGICGGEIYLTECYSTSRSSSVATAQLVVQPELYSGAASQATVQLWLGTRECFSSARSSSTVDLASGLTILSDYGMRVDNVNTLRVGGGSSDGYGVVTVGGVAYAQIIDIVSDYLIYKGWAEVGSLTSAPVWRIQKIVIGFDDDVTKTWADGNAEFDNIWDDHLSLVYS